jgi:signal transduction histidine kinase
MPTDVGGGAPLAARDAPTHRARGDALRRDIERAAGHPLVDAILRTVGGVAAVLNRDRQILAVNDAYLTSLGVERPSQALGLRPGEAIGCVHAADRPEGCGAGPVCTTCGAAAAMSLALERGQPEERECVVTVQRGSSRLDLDMRVRACPLPVEGRDLMLFTLVDVSQEKRRAGLEQAFFHDVANLVAGLTAAAVALPVDDPDELRAVAADIRLIAARLGRELETQRVLSGGRAADFEPAVEKVGLDDLVERLSTLVHRHPAAAGKRLRAPAAGLGAMVTDPLLLERVLTNMLVNAFEATSRGDEVALEVEERPEAVLFRVWNPGAIAASVAPRIFQRYFTTKHGAGRGQGTYTMKLVGEEVLGGEVRFTSSPTGGTAFTLRLPRLPPPMPAAIASS